MTKKTFDCVDMKRQGAAALRRKLAGLSPKQELAFWQAEDRKLRERQERLRHRASAKQRR
jgi:hypothetical protein